MKKILIVSTVSRQFYLFEKCNIEVLKSLGYEVHGAANFDDANDKLDELDIIRHPFDIQRSPFSFRNLTAYEQLKKIMKEENYDAVHCHSPMGGVLARLAAKASNTRPVIYTAHGFHFYKGAPLVNWIVYYPIEKFLSRLTDVIITINHEDYERASKKFKAKKVVYIPGIGVDTKKISDSCLDRDKKRRELGISPNTTVVLSVGEMIKRKNHETAIKALKKLKSRNFIYLICGKGELQEQLKGLVKELQLEDKVRFLGYRNDIYEICSASDIFLFTSFQEGLPVSVMEAMAGGLPIVCSKIRGNTDLIENGKNGFMCSPTDIDEFAKAIDKLMTNEIMFQKMREENFKRVRLFDKQVVKNCVKNLYFNIAN